MSKPIPQDLLDAVTYDPTSPSGLRWKVSGTGRRPDRVAGAMLPRGYWQLRFKGINYLVHRVVWALHHGDPAGSVVDHIDGGRTNNKIENLQEISGADNSARRVGRGCTLHKPTGKWKAQIRVNRELHYLGLFDTEEAARAAYLAAKAKATEGLNVTL